jgi:hypothetical protein
MPQVRTARVGSQVVPVATDWMRVSIALFDIREALPDSNHQLLAFFLVELFM